MVSFDCPWCEEPAALPLPLADEAEASFTCPDCGTAVDWADEPVALDLAA
jgi:predicted RNA-binding Zn-ribbon protein involved in translation (DUF1610 family)